MQRKNLKILILGFAAFLLLLTPATAQEAGKIYVINLNYKEEQPIETLSVVNAYLTQGNAIDYGEPTAGYRLDIISQNNEVLKSIKFSVPIGAVVLKGLTSENVDGSPKNLNFTIYTPYFTDGKFIRMYDKNNAQIAELPVQLAYGLGATETMEGELEVIHADDFENPQNSRYFFYLNTGRQRYELESFQKIPPVRSGVPISVRGKLVGDKIIVEEMSVKPDVGQAGIVPNEISLQKFETKPKVNLKFAYAGIALIVLVIAISLVHYRNKTGASNIRNYIIANLKKGYSKEQIRKALSKSGYSIKEIDESFRGIK